MLVGGFRLSRGEIVDRLLRSQCVPDGWRGPDSELDWKLVIAHRPLNSRPGPDTLGDYFECWFEDYLGQFVLMIASFAAALSVFTSSLLFLGFKKLLINTSKTQD